MATAWRRRRPSRASTSRASKSERGRACACALRRAATSSTSRSRVRSHVVESIEQDYEGRNHLAVVLEDDPGRDMGMMRQPGHRFFFSPGRGRARDEAVTATGGA